LSKNYKIARLAGFVVVVVSLLVAGVGFKIVRDDVNVLRDSGRENILWSAVQTEIELLRFLHELEQFAEGQGQSSVASVNVRFDILWSRVAQFDQGSAGRRLKSYDQTDKAVDRLFSKMKEQEPHILALKYDDYGQAMELVAEFRPFLKELRNLSRSVLHGEEHARAGYRENLASSSSTLTIISALVVMASVIMLFVFSRESNRFRVLAELNVRLLAVSDKANEAKSQFLAMMSHELRTPMNGVLGLLALARQQGLGVRQEGLVIQAERSGRQMIGLLEDILDYSGLQDGNLTLEQKPFDPNELAQAVSDMFQPVAKREGTKFGVSVDPSCPRLVMGDFVRIRQALNHLATYLLETAGTRSIALDISHANGALRAAISFDYSKTGGEWRPELIMGTTAQLPGRFATEALGPSVARGLIDQMGGTTLLDSPVNDRIVVLVRIPAEEFFTQSLLIAIECKSTALKAICKAALQPHNVTFLEKGDTRAPHVVIIQAGNAAEREAVQKWENVQPHALLVALGRPLFRNAFDDVMDVPIDVVNVNRQKFMQLQPDSNTVARNSGMR